MIEIYTDGSGKGGWGAVVIYSDHVEEIGGRIRNPTNNRAELTAVIKSLQYIKERKEHIKLYSDSAYIVNCIQQGWYKNWKRNGWMTTARKPVKNQDLWKELLEELYSHNCEILKVKAHDGVMYNERADAIASEWANSP